MDTKWHYSTFVFQKRSTHYFPDVLRLEHHFIIMVWKNGDEYTIDNIQMTQTKRAMLP